jgi:hypothetical protein
MRRLKVDFVDGNYEVVEADRYEVNGGMYEFFAGSEKLLTTYERSQVRGIKDLGEASSDRAVRPPPTRFTRQRA